MKRGIFICMLAVFFIITAVDVSAVGIWAREMGSKFDFSPGMQKTFSYVTHSTTDETMDYEIYVAGDLAQYARFEPQILEKVPAGGRASFIVVLSLPDKIGEPGIYSLRVGVRELPEAFKAGTGVGGRTAAEDRIDIRVLYPGKFPQASLNIPDGNVNEMIRCTVSIANWGEEAIESCKAIIYIYDAENATIATLYTDSVGVPRGGSAEISAVLDTLGFAPGEYYGKADVDCDGQEITAEDGFRIGSLDVRLKSYSNEFAKNNINPFHVEVESGWNNEIKDVYAVIELPNGKIQTPAGNLAPWGTTRLTAYWDTSGLELGEYNATITLHFAGQSKKEPIRVRVVEKPVEEKPTTIISTSTIIIILIILLVLFNMIWLLKNKRPTDKSGVAGYET